MLRTPNAVEEIAALRSAHDHLSRVVSAYQRLYSTLLYVAIRAGAISTLEGGDLLVCAARSGVSQVFLYSRRAYVPRELGETAAIAEIDGPRLWGLLLQVLESGKCEATIDGGQTHEIRLSREAVVAMVRVCANLTPENT